jgi:hypothetical protein
MILSGHLVTIAIIVALSAVADPPAGPPPEARFTYSVRGDLGIASPVGFAGVLYSYEPAGWLLVEGGVGYGLSGLQLSLMPKLVLGASSHRFTAGVGASVGIPGIEIVTDSPTGGNVNEHVVTPWLNVDIAGYDYRSATGFSFVASGGISVALAHGCAVSIDSCFPLYGTVFPQLRIGFGHWF